MSIGATDIQRGFMAVIRGIARNPPHSEDAMTTWADEYVTMLEDCEKRSEKLTDWECGVRPRALAQALRGIADGFDQQRPWFRPDALVMHTLRRAADELERMSDALATESSRKCATEHDCVWQPHCAHAGKCMRPERPFGA